MEDMRQKLSNLSRGLGKWSRDTFGSVRKEIKQLKQVLKEIRSDPLRTGPSHAELKVNERLIEMYHEKRLCGIKGLESSGFWRETRIQSFFISVLVTAERKI